MCEKKIFFCLRHQFRSDPQNAGCGTNENCDSHSRPPGQEDERRLLEIKHPRQESRQLMELCCGNRTRGCTGTGQHSRGPSVQERQSEAAEFLQPEIGKEREQPAHDNRILPVEQFQRSQEKSDKRFKSAFPEPVTAGVFVQSRSRFFTQLRLISGSRFRIYTIFQQRKNVSA